MVIVKHDKDLLKAGHREVLREIDANVALYDAESRENSSDDARFARGQLQAWAAAQKAVMRMVEKDQGRE